MRERQAIYVWLLVALSGCYYSKADGQIRDLNCLNDYDTQMICTWEVTFDTNCSTEYQLIYERRAVPLPSNSCIPINLNHHGVVIPNKCFCIIVVPAFHVGDQYDIEVQSHGTVLQSDLIYPYQTIKPKPPEGLTAEFNENGDSILSWDKKYSSSNILSKFLTFEIYYYNKQDPSEQYTVLLNQLETRFEISRSQLKLGYEYVAKVRTKAKEVFEGNWSDYSPEIQWRNDRTNNFVFESMPLIVTLICLLMLVLVAAGYFSIRTVKKNWDMIPDPSKSNILFTIVGGSKVSDEAHVYGAPPSGKNQWSHVKITCWSWLVRFKFPSTLLDQDAVQSHASKTAGNQPSAGGPNEKSKPIYSKNHNDTNKCDRPILIPEYTLVEPCQILTKQSAIDKTPHDEVNSEEDKEVFEGRDDLFFNPAINDLILDLLAVPIRPSENLVIAVDEYKPCDNNGKENTLLCKKDMNGPSVFSFFTEDNQPVKDEGSCGSTSPKPTLSLESCEYGYRSFESEVSHYEEKTHSGSDHSSGFAHSSEMQVDFLSAFENSQTESTNEIGNSLTGEDMGASRLDFDSQYRSFTSAVSESQLEGNGRFLCPPSPVSLNLFDVKCPLIYNTSQLHGSSQQFYNNEKQPACQNVSSQNFIPDVFASHEDEGDLFFTPHTELFANILSHDMPRKTSPTEFTSFIDPAGYQSFENAIK
ncbi:interleukin-4 receptor subunit alpha [Ambystoma mexicanum]|uniref:interleukin-4 receptor subunit alpha n=1 Tax=Ambystoma mexicanum TaxID=8296 RepID=UPI0037E6FBEE